MLLLTPHLQQFRQVLIPVALRLQRAQVLAQVVLHVPVAPLPELGLDRGHEFGVNVARERVARVIGQDAHEHDGVVLDVVRGFVWRGEVPANAMGGLLGGVGTAFGSFDDEGQVDEFLSGGL